MKKIFYSIAVALGLVAMTGCDLTERNYSNIDASVYYQNENSVKGAVGAIYNEAAMGFCEYFYYLQEFPADQIGWRTWNGGQWGWDEGLKFVLSSHTWTSEATIVLQAWQKAWKTIGLCNQLIADLEKLDLGKMQMSAEARDAYIAEVRTLRAWAYYNNFELWGGALPLCTTVSSEVPGSISDNFDEGCQKMFDFIAKELDNAYPHLKDNGALRVNPAMNRMIKMRLLLNSEVFTGVDRYKECEDLIGEMNDAFGEKYGIVDDFRQIYELGNENCKEVVFAFAETNGQLNTGWMRNMPFLSYAYDLIYDPFATNQGAWNCVILTPSYDNSGEETVYPAIENNGGFNKYPAGGMYGGTDNPKSFVKDYGDKLGAVSARFEPTDIRRQDYKFDENGWNGGIFVTGLQRNIKNDTVITADADRTGQPLIYIDQVGQFAGTTSSLGRALEDVQSPRWGQTNSGYRMIKYPLYTAESGIDFQSISEVEFRWAEVKYTLAECKMRRGDKAGMMSEVNDVRKRYFKGAMTDVAASWTPEEWMLHQWGIEFLGEGRRRRTDLRRFDQFTQGQWWFFGRAKDDQENVFPAKRDRKYEWYPLPASALTVNPGLKQNPNY